MTISFTPSNIGITNTVGHVILPTSYASLFDRVDSFYSFVWMELALIVDTGT